jgi:hypothetical protein
LHRGHGERSPASFAHFIGTSLFAIKYKFAAKEMEGFSDLYALLLTAQIFKNQACAFPWPSAKPQEQSNIHLNIIIKRGILGLNNQTTV